jgi:hypothetical protein
VVERFRLEGRLVAGLAHPNIVRVYDFGEDGGRPYMVMEYVAGQNLRQIIARETPMSLKRVTSIMRQLAAALDFAHANGVIHRDIKPENILVTDRGEVKVGDFGIARALAGAGRTSAGTVLGTAAYASPEQFSSQAVTAESDLYSAGVVLYELLTGHVPFPGENSVAVGMAQVTQQPPPPSTYVPSLSREIEAVVLKALAKDPAGRYHSGFELVTALQNAGKAIWTPGEPRTATAGGQRDARPAEANAVTKRTVVAPQVAMAPALQQRRARSRKLPVALLACILLAMVTAAISRGRLDGGSSVAQPPATAIPAAGQTQVVSDATGSSHGAAIALVTAAGVDQNYLPIGVSSRFHLTTGDIYAVATVRNKAQGDSVRFTWRFPNGSTYVYDNTIVDGYTGTVIAYAQLAPSIAGAYSVSTDINGQTLASASFTVVSG